MIYAFRYIAIRGYSVYQRCAEQADSARVMAPAFALLFGKKVCNDTLLISVQADETRTDSERMVNLVHTREAYLDICLEGWRLRQGNQNTFEYLATAGDVVCVDKSAHPAGRQVEGFSRCAVAFEVRYSDGYCQSGVQSQAKMFTPLEPDHSPGDTDPVQGDAAVAADGLQAAGQTDFHTLQAAMDNRLAFFDKGLVGRGQVEFIQVIAVLVFPDAKDGAAGDIGAAGHLHAEQFMLGFKLVQGGDDCTAAGDVFLTVIAYFPPECAFQCCEHWPCMTHRWRASVPRMVP